VGGGKVAVQVAKVVLAGLPGCITQWLEHLSAGSERGSYAHQLALIVDHTDDAREVAYDRQSHVGKLDKALDEAQARGCTVVDMKNDWNAIFPEK
jgi:hypothetical protein